MEKRFEFRIALQARTKQFALRVLKLFQSLPKTDEARIIGKQLLRSATSVAANYRSTCRSRSAKEYYSKLSIVIEECDESMFWLEFLADSKIIVPSLLENLTHENEELLKIFVTARKRTKPEASN